MLEQLQNKIPFHYQLHVHHVRPDVHRDAVLNVFHRSLPRAVSGSAQQRTLQGNLRSISFVSVVTVEARRHTLTGGNRGTIFSIFFCIWTQLIRRRGVSTPETASGQEANRRTTTAAKEVSGIQFEGCRCRWDIVILHGRITLDPTHLARGDGKQNQNRTDCEDSDDRGVRATVIRWECDEPLNWSSCRVVAAAIVMNGWEREKLHPTHRRDRHTETIVIVHSRDKCIWPYDVIKI